MESNAGRQIPIQKYRKTRFSRKDGAEKVSFYFLFRKCLQLPFLSLFARYRQVLSTSSKPRNLEGVSTDLLGGFGSDNGVTDLSDTPEGIW
jgi:hypothetical protein